LCDDEEIIQLRMREIKLRLLDKTKVYEKGRVWVILNTVIPVLSVLIIGLLVFLLRKYRYTKKI